MRGIGAKPFCFCLAQGRCNTRMGILHIEYRIVFRRLNHLGEVEIHLRVGFARQHREADDILSDFLNDFSKRDKTA